MQTEPAAPTAPPRLPREIWVIVAANVAVAAGFGLVAPALPTFARSFDVSVTAASVIISAFAFTRLVFAPASGKLVSRLGERPVYLWGLIIVAVTTGAAAFSAAYWQLLLFRSLSGIGSTMFTVSSIALLVRLAPPELRGRATGLWATGFLLGSIAGPVLGGGLITVSLRAPFLAYAGALLVATAVAWFFLRRSTLLAPVPEDGIAPLTVRRALRHRAYRAAVTSNFANGWGVFGVRVSLVPLFVTEVLRREPALAGIALAVFAAGNVAVLLVAGRIADSRGRRLPVLAGLLVSGASTVWLGFTDSVTTFMMATALTGLGTGMLTPPQGAAVADVVGAKGKGGPALAGFQMAADVGAILGPVVTGLIADRLSFAAAFTLTGTISLLALLVWLRAPETLPSRTPTEPEPDTRARAAECGCLDEGPELPSGRWRSGWPRHPDP